MNAHFLSSATDSFTYTRKKKDEKSETDALNAHRCVFCARVIYSNPISDSGFRRIHVDIRYYLEFQTKMKHIIIYIDYFVMMIYSDEKKCVDAKPPCHFGKCCMENTLSLE